MKKIIIIFLIILYIFTPISNAVDEEIMSSQKEALGITDFIKEANNYTQKSFENVNMEEIFSSAITGEISSNKILDGILNLLGKEVKNALKTLAAVLVIILIHSILKAISENLENEGVSKITYYVQYILIVSLVMTNFSEIIIMIKEAIQNLVGFSYSLLPLLITLMLTTGNITTASIVQPILLFLITFIGNIVVNVLLPIILVGTALGIVSKISDKIQMDKIAKFLKSGAIWLLGIVLTIFVGVLSLEGTLSSGVDGITAKTAKATVSGFVPVVGKILGDAVDSVIGCANILKGAVGIVGVIVMLGICVLPIIKLTILTATYYGASAICQPLADEKITSLLSQMGDTFKTMLALIFTVSTMLIIGVTLVVKISNSGLMYR